MNGQYRFDPDGNVTVVRSDAKERRAPEVQYSLDQLAKDTENARKWNIDTDVTETIDQHESEE